MLYVKWGLVRLSYKVYISFMTFTSVQSVRPTYDMLETSSNAMSIDQALGFTVNQYLFVHGVTRAELGKIRGVAGSNVSNRLHGKSRWTASDLAAVAEAFGVTPADLFPTRGGAGWVPAPYVPGTGRAPAVGGGGPGGVVGGAPRGARTHDLRIKSPQL